MKESIIGMLDKARDKLPQKIKDQADAKNKEFVPLTGACGIMFKTFLMEAFCGENEMDDMNLPSIWCMPCTSAANCCVSSKKYSKCGYRYGLPNFHDPRGPV